MLFCEVWEAVRACGRAGDRLCLAPAPLHGLNPAPASPPPAPAPPASPALPPGSAYPATLSSAEWLSTQPGAADFAAAADRQARMSSLASADGEELSGPLRPPPPPLASTSGPDSPPAPSVEALDVAHRSTRVPGSATACVVRLDPQRGVLDAANLGDSGFLVIRDGQLLFQSPAQQHFFDCPLQVGAADGPWGPCAWAWGCWWRLRLAVCS